jgi:type IV pilus assembly protein PilA
MIVVAIVGIRAAVAIPTFLRYQSKARQTEVKGNLGGIFVIEASYSGENGRYGSFSEIGFALAGAANLDTDPVLDHWSVNDVKKELQTAGSNDVLN